MEVPSSVNLKEPIEGNMEKLITTIKENMNMGTEVSLYHWLDELTLMIQEEDSLLLH